MSKKTKALSYWIIGLMCFIQIGNYPAALGSTPNMGTKPPISSQIISYETNEYPQMDTFIDSENQTQNFGENEFLFLQNDTNQKIVFLYYDLILKPDFYSSVELIIPVSKYLGVKPFSIWLINEEWKEATLTYENQPVQRQKLNLGCSYNFNKITYQFNLTKHIGMSHNLSIAIEYNILPGNLIQLFSTEHLVNSIRAPYLSWKNEEIFTITHPTRDRRVDPKQPFIIMWEYRGRDVGNLTIELCINNELLVILSKDAINNGSFHTRPYLLSDYSEQTSFMIKITINKYPTCIIQSDYFFIKYIYSDPPCYYIIPFFMSLLAVVVVLTITILLVKKNIRDKANKEVIIDKDRPALENKTESEIASNIKLEIHQIPQEATLDPTFILTSILEHGIQKTFNIIREQIYAQGIADPTNLNQKTLCWINTTLERFGYVLK